MAQDTALTTQRDSCWPGSTGIWGVFLLVLALGWIANTLGWLGPSIWRFAGPLGLAFAGIMMLMMRRR